MKRLLAVLMAAAMLLSFAACGGTNTDTDDSAQVTPEVLAPVTERYADAVHIDLSDDMTEAPAGVSLSRDIVYYEAGKDFTYGEGTAEDEHTAEEAAEHLVVTVTEPGDYLLTGKLSKGQIAVDLGDDAEEDPNAVVTLIFGGADITCTVAPAVIFYNVYECGDADNPTKDVDTSKAGAKVIIADGTENHVNGSYVARIYKSVVLSDDGTQVIDSKKLHKYDGAFYSKMSMDMDGGEQDSGLLYITAENEGLDSEMHLTINGGNVNIVSGNDGINTNEDGVSVTTVNGGSLTILVDGSTGEGDGIDSNGWLVINGGTVIAQGCGTSMDAGIDSDMGIYLNGGIVMAAGNMLDRIAGGKATYATFTFTSESIGGKSLTLKNADGEAVLEWTADNDYMYVVATAPELVPGDYTLWAGETQLSHGGSAGGFGGRGPMGGMEGFDPNNMQMPEGMEGFDPNSMERPEGMEGFDLNNMQMPEGMEMPEGMSGFDFGNMQMPQGGFGGNMQMPEGMEGFDPNTMELPEGMEDFDFEGMQRPEGMDGTQQESTERSDVFTIVEGGNSFVI